MISIPRDLWVSIPGYENNRINTAYQVGVSTRLPRRRTRRCSKKRSNTISGIRIDHTAMVDFDGFRKIVDTAGGVDVPVSCAYRLEIDDPSYDPELEANWYLHTVERRPSHGWRPRPLVCAFASKIQRLRPGTQTTRSDPRIIHAGSSSRH
ncbi:MAG: LCP family protein [Anaerolineales bacterium]